MSEPSQNKTASKASTNSQVQAKTASSQGGHKIIVVVVVCLLLAAVGGYFAYQAYAVQQANAKFVEMMSATNEATSATYQATGELAVTLPPEIASLYQLGEGASEYDLSVDLQMEGEYDISDEDLPKTSSLISVQTEALRDFMPEISPIELEIQNKLIGEALYVQFSNIPQAPLFDFSMLNDQWIKLAQEDFDSDLAPGMGEELSSVQMTQEEREEIQNMFVESEIVTISQVLSSKEINGVDMYHYRYSINPDAFMQLAQDIAEEDDSIPEITETQLTEANKLFEQIDTLGGEMWISKEDLLLHKLTFDFATTIQSEELQLPPIDIQMEFEAEYENYNEPVNITAPESAQSIEEIMGALYGGATEAQSNPEEMERVNDLKLVESAMDSMGLDAGGVYPSDPSQLSNYVADTVEFVPNAEDPTRYCIYTELPESSAPYTFYAASHVSAGYSTSQTEPTLDNCVR